MYYGNKTIKILEQCNKKRHIPGSESFKANIKNGIVLVECRECETFIESFIYSEGCNETRTSWAGATAEAAKHLETLEIDLSSIQPLHRVLGCCLLLKNTTPKPIQYNLVCEGFGKLDNEGEPCEFCQNCSLHHPYGE